MKRKYNAFALIRLVFLFCIPATTLAADPHCILHGMITPIDQNTEAVTLTNMIRMHFDADEQKKCERMLRAYCTYHVKNKSYSPLKLTATFRGDMSSDHEIKYSFTPSCELVSNE